MAKLTPTELLRERLQKADAACEAKDAEIAALKDQLAKARASYDTMRVKDIDGRKVREQLLIVKHCLLQDVERIDNLLPHEPLAITPNTSSGYARFG